MKFTLSTPIETPVTSNSILVAKDSAHSGALHGLVSNGGKKSVGNYIVEFVNDGGPFTTIQIYQCALGITPSVQRWNKTKVVKEKVIVQKTLPKAKEEKQKVEINTNSSTEELL